MQFRTFLLSFSFLLLLAFSPSCKNGQKATSEEVPSKTKEPITTKNEAPTETMDRSILLGRGGGFTGKYLEYLIKEDGTVLKKDYTTEDLSPHKTLDADLVDALFSQADKMRLIHIDHSDPGNMTTYLEWRINRQYHRITWGGGNKVVPEGLEDLFNELINAAE